VADKDDSIKKKVDEGWKEKAREEKESLQQEAGGEKADSEKADSVAPPEDQTADAETEEGPEKARGEFPEPTFATLVSGLAAQAFVYLGQAEDPAGGQREVDPEAARHVLDTLGMLQEKTEGNLTDQERAYLEEILYNLRMIYVSRTQQRDSGKSNGATESK